MGLWCIEGIVEGPEHSTTVVVERPERGSAICDVKEPEVGFTAVVYGRFVGTKYGEGDMGVL